ncbi:hypothetical protein AVEN_74365-1, partial [Araneus ventricosus]
MSRQESQSVNTDISLKPKQRETGVQPITDVLLVSGSDKGHLAPAEEPLASRKGP